MIMNLLNCFSHIYPGSSSYLSVWHGMLLYFPLFHISTHFSVPKLFGSPSSQRHVPTDVSLTQAVLSLNQHHVWDPLAISKPMNQRFFVPLFFSVKFLTKCHSFSVSIETSKPFFLLLHSFSAFLQLKLSLWKVYSEQTVTNVYGKPNDKREKRKTRKNDLFTYLLTARITRGYTEGELNKTLGHTQKFYICHGAVGIGWTKLWISKIKSLHKSTYLRGGIHIPFSFNPMFNDIKVNLNPVCPF